MKKIYPFISFFFLLLSGCNNLEDATLTSRTTFMHFYEGANSYRAAAAEITDDGYIIAGTIQIANDTISPKIIVIKTDELGQKQWERIINGGSASSLKVWSNGYIVIGDSIQYNPDSETISELENNSSRLILLDMNGAITTDLSYAIKGINRQVDFHGDAATLDDQGNVITLGTYQAPGQNEFAYIVALNPGSLDTLWTKSYDYLQRDYVNSRSVHYSAGNILWGTTVSVTQGNFNRSYLAVPVIPENSVFVNSDYFGENTDQSLIINDLQSSPLGYCAVGTFSHPDGTGSNAFFIRVDKNGNFKEESIRYFDGVLSAENEALSDPLISETEDFGEAITATRDGGYVLAGSLETTPSRGNGGKDIWLIKIDGSGNPLWNKIIGGATNETVSSIRETDDGSLLICGTVQDGDEETGGLSSIFLIKTDSNGELKN